MINKKNNSLKNYKKYHTNKINVFIHKICIPLLLITFYSIISYKKSFLINCFYFINYLLYDFFSIKSRYSIIYLQVIYLIHILFKKVYSKKTNIILHCIAWVLQIIGHRYFENNSPALLDNLYNSILFAPYLIFLETFYSKSFTEKKKHFAIHEICNQSNKTILYLGGLFQNSKKVYNPLSLSKKYNHIFITLYKLNNNVIHKIIKKIQNEPIHYIIGFSFGGSIALQLKNKLKKPIKTILISPAGFSNNSLLEKFICFFSKWMYVIYQNNKWYMIMNYPLYLNNILLTDTDFLIVSKKDWIHNSSLFLNHSNKIQIENVSHLNMISSEKTKTIIKNILV